MLKSYSANKTSAIGQNSSKKAPQTVAASITCSLCQSPIQLCYIVVSHSMRYSPNSFRQTCEPASYPRSWKWFTLLSAIVSSLATGTRSNSHCFVPLREGRKQAKQFKAVF